eukprot:CAMPEP_0171078572 /NCGR_PEP_ID=MMETSP0766_2-20121228/14723_1 /TAXON_ID=439317 /ORGANISM="Gambierdiscus australes, Strain CAWD 149" /LENGTH=105 /DNA_ID=CAMNT_0011535711 /DNA_START=318 /DNA_END=633 /DNA_ORIENTATION=-
MASSATASNLARGSKRAGASASLPSSEHRFVAFNLFRACTEDAQPNPPRVQARSNQAASAVRRAKAALPGAGACARPKVCVVVQPHNSGEAVLDMKIYGPWALTP